MKLVAPLKTGLEKVLNSPEFGKSLIYIAASTVGYGIVFLQNFSLAYFLTIDFFGKVTLIISLFSTLYILFTFGMNAVVQRFYFDKKYGADKKALISHIATLWLLLGTCLSLLFLIAGYRLLVVDSLLPLDYFEEFVPVLFGAFFFSFTEIYPNFFVVQEKPVHYAIWLILSRFTIFVLLHAAVYLFGESSLHVSLTLLISGVILSTTGIVGFKIFPVLNLKMEHLKEILLYSFPLMIYALGGIGYSHGYRVIISNWLTYEQLGVFSLTNQITQVYYLTAASCITGLYPRAYRALEDNQGDPVAIRFYFKALLYIGLGLLLIVGSAGYFILHYFKAGAFLGGIEIFPILLLSQFIFFLYGYNYVLCTFYKKTRIITYSMLTGVITSLSLAFILLKEYAVWGAAIPIACGAAVQFFVSFILIRNVLKSNTQDVANR